MAAGVAGRKVDRDRERCSRKRLEFVYGLIHGQDTSGKGIAGAADAVAHLHRELAQHVRPVGHSGRGHPVRDQDGLLLAFDLQPKPDDRRIHVDPIADRFGIDIVAVQDRPGDPGLPDGRSTASH